MHWVFCVNVLSNSVTGLLVSLASKAGKPKKSNKGNHNKYWGGGEHNQDAQQNTR